MPTPDRTSLEEILAAARRLVESGGPTSLTMQAVANEVGVRAPSLYKRVASRDALVRLVGEQVARELGARLSEVASENPAADARTLLAALGTALRAFAHANPASYRLIFAPSSADSAPDQRILAEASAPLLAVSAELAGDDDALSAARTVTAWAHGFITMELAGAFRLGGDVEAAWEYGLRSLAQSLHAHPGH